MSQPDRASGSCLWGAVRFTASPSRTVAGLSGRANQGGHMGDLIRYGVIGTGF